MENFTLLFVDDEPNILRSLQRIFKKSDYRVMVAQSGEEALELMTRESIDVLVSDQMMPGIKGTELCRKVKELYPGIIRVILSAYADSQQLVCALAQGEVCRTLTKPMDLSIIEQIIELIIEQVKVIRSSRRIIEFLNRMGPGFSCKVDCITGAIKVNIEGENFPLDENKIAGILHSLFNWPEAEHDVLVMSAGLARYNGTIALNLEFNGGLGMSMELPAQDIKRNEP